MTTKQKKVVIHDMHESDIASKAKNHGVRSVPVNSQGAARDAARTSMFCGPRSSKALQ
jgi:hypothetical protein